MARSRSGSKQRVSPLVWSVAEAAADSHAAGIGADNLRKAVVDLSRLATISILENGVVASDDLRIAVDAVATRHLKRAAADRQLTRAIRRVSDPAIRDAVEVAHAQVLDVSELAHYYAGLMAGLAMMEWGRDRR
jgi:hypothetical protein